MTSTKRPINDHAFMSRGYYGMPHKDLHYLTGSPITSQHRDAMESFSQYWVGKRVYCLSAWGEYYTSHVEGMTELVVGKVYTVKYAVLGRPWTQQFQSRFYFEEINDAGEIYDTLCAADLGMTLVNMGVPGYAIQAFSEVREHGPHKWDAQEVLDYILRDHLVGRKVLLDMVFDNIPGANTPKTGMVYTIRDAFMLNGVPHITLMEVINLRPNTIHVDYTSLTDNTREIGFAAYAFKLMPDDRTGALRYDPSMYDLIRCAAYTDMHEVSESLGLGVAPQPGSDDVNAVLREMHVGRKVLCGENCDEPGAEYNPEPGLLYTVRDVRHVGTDGDIEFCFLELPNRRVSYTDGFREPYYPAACFYELDPQEYNIPMEPTIPEISPEERVDEYVMQLWI